MQTITAEPARAAGTATLVPPAVPDPIPRMGVWKGVVASVAVALLVAMNEVSKLSGQMLDPEGRTWSFAGLMGTGRLGNLVDLGHWVPAMSSGWTATFPGFEAARLQWLTLYVVLDLAFIVIYGGVVARWLFTLGRTVLARGLALLAVVDVVEDGLALLAAHHPSATTLAVIASGLTAEKWLTVVVVAALATFAVLQSQAVLRSWLRALYTQRFSVIAILPIAALTIPAGSDLLDQLPDVERRWVESAQGWQHFGTAVLAVLVTAAGLLVLGRFRTGAYWQRTRASVRQEGLANLWLGLVVLAAVLVPLLLVSISSRVWPWALPGLEGKRLLAFLTIPAAITFGSLGIRCARARRQKWAHRLFAPTRHWVPDPADKRRIWVVGDVLVAVALVVTGLGLIRAYTAVIALTLAGLGDRSWWGLVPLAVGLAAVVGGWFGARAVADLVTNPAAAGGPGTWWDRVRAVLTPTVPVPGSLLRRVLVLAVGLALFFTVGLAYAFFAQVLGVIATALAALLAATLVVGGCVVLVQDRRAPEVFWLRGIQLSSLPVTTLLLVTVVWTTGIGSSVDIHGLRGLTQTNAPLPGAADRPSLAQAIAAWQQRTSGCGRPVPGSPYRLRPMFLFAAEGGGIRAAYWTAAALDILRGAVPTTGGEPDWTNPNPQPNPCASALFAGGASGGAVGMTVARFADGELARNRVHAMAAPEALGAATSGLFVRDTAFAATGIPFFGAPTYAGNADTPRWTDRAGLIEESWERTSGLDRPFLSASQTTPGTAAPVTGSLVLNSTRVADGCRMWVSQLRLSTGEQTSCQFSDSTPAGNSVDLLSALGAGSNPADPRDVRCLGSLRASTGTMLAARFPFVTPSGVLGPCGGQGEQQLVDGGYVENSGLGTIVDLAPQWLDEVRKRNDEALKPGGSQELVVPVVVYFDNGTGGDLTVDPPPSTPEILVPTTTRGRAAALVDTPALLRNCARVVAGSELASAGLPAELEAPLARWRGNGVVVVQQSTVPSVSAPLGWVLSEQSMATMDAALARQAAPPSAQAERPAPITRYGTLATAIALTRQGPQ